VNSSNEKIDFNSELLLLIKDYTNYESVGIRLIVGNDFPYYKTEGFAESSNYSKQRGRL